MQSSRISTSWIATPVIMGLVVSWAAIISITYVATNEIDATNLQREIRLARSTTRLIGDDISHLSGDYSYWNEAIQNLVLEPNVEWASENIGDYIHESFGITGAFVVSNDARTLFAYEDGNPSSVHVFDRFSEGLVQLIAKSEAASIAQPIPVSGLFLSEGQLQIVTASIFMPENSDDGIELGNPRPALILSRVLGKPLLAKYAEILQLPGLVIETAPRLDASIPLKGPDGRILGHLAWDFEPVGYRFLASVGLPIAFAVFFTGLFIWLFMHRVIFHAQRKLHAANVVKSQFLANTSHELRTPLNAIIGFSEIIKMKMYGALGSNEKYESYIENIHDSAGHLLSLINDILDVSAIEANKLDLDEDRLCIDTITQSAVQLVQVQYDNKAVQLEVEVPADFPPLLGDERRIKQVLVNLLSNAVKFTQEGGTVRLKAGIDDKGYMAIKVEDTGIGMDKDGIKKALEPFGQVDSGLDRKQEGAGLGLPLTKSLVEAHEGTLTIESGLGAGTTATARFPVERVVEPA